ncbi:MAG TPA: DUF1499 domain-containing protein [Longimicrobiales bacterium]|nr:DUF1499 domain-containing protein [Longimicrobiales bacterium]
MPGIWRALTRNVAETAQAHEDARLRGRTYAIPFEDVWNAAQAVAGVGMRGWRIVSSDDEEGVIHAESTTLMRRKIDDVSIRITLDRDAQTRVDARSAARAGRGDLGRNARRLNRFFHALDRAVVDARRRRLESRPAATPASGASVVPPHRST